MLRHWRLNRRATCALIFLHQAHLCCPLCHFLIALWVQWHRLILSKLHRSEQTVQSVILMSYMLISRTEPVTAITDLCAQGHRGVTFCAATVTARGARLLVFTTEGQKCGSEYAQMTLLWGRHYVFVRNAQRAPGWHFSSWEATLAADAPLSSYSSFLLLLLLLLLLSARGGGGREGKSREEGGRVTWCRSVPCRQRRLC